MVTRKIYKYDHEAGEVVEAQELERRRHANVSHSYIPDEMDAVKHPGDGKYYTSKAKFRETTRALGYEEVGTAYEHGYDPGKELQREQRDLSRRLAAQVRERYYDTRSKRRK